MPIYVADTFTNLTIVKVTGSDKIKDHLANLGFVPGETVMVINKMNDNIIVKLKGVSLAISKELSKRIFV